MARRKEIRNEWYKLSDGMMRALREAAMKCTKLTDQQRNKWIISTTHDEVSNCTIDHRRMLIESKGSVSAICSHKNLCDFPSTLPHIKPL